MEEDKSKSISYFSITDIDEVWGVVVTTVGLQPIPQGSSYPRSQHPDSYIFKPAKGRILKEYQLVYITAGNGYFESESCEFTKIKAGAIIMLFPNEWHTYYPDPNSGWFEYWVGFRGREIDALVEAGFFQRSIPIFNIGISTTIINLYESIVHHAIQEKSAYQQLISGMLMMMIGNVYYKNKNLIFTDHSVISKINDARTIMKRNIEEQLSLESIAQQIGMSYSWFRQMYKKYTGQSPLQYQLHLKYLRAKELLEKTNMPISDIAFRLQFESLSQFSTFFKKKYGLSPKQYRLELDIDESRYRPEIIY